MQPAIHTRLAVAVGLAVAAGICTVVLLATSGADHGPVPVPAFATGQGPATEPPPEQATADVAQAGPVARAAEPVVAVAPPVAPVRAVAAPRSPHRVAAAPAGAGKPTPATSKKPHRTADGAKDTPTVKAKAPGQAPPQRLRRLVVDPRSLFLLLERRDHRSRTDAHFPVDLFGPGG